MPFKIITGTFHVVGYSPDGDSIRFQADNVSHLFDLAGSDPRINARGHAQLRIEGIDTLETHFNPAGGGTALRQPEAFAIAATDLLLDYLGIRNVVWNARHAQVVSADDGTPGFILSRSVEKNGRPVAFVFTGDPPDVDGSDFRLETDFLQASYNFLALDQGLSYATYYWGLFHDLRDALTEAVTSSRAAGRGLYAQDVTNTGFSVDTVADLTDHLVIMPKLFRRLSEYFVSTGTIVGFKEALADSREPVLEIQTANFTHFDTFIEQAPGSNHLRLTVLPEGLVFDPMPARPSNAFAMVVEEREEEAVMEMLGAD
jgi:hypothetical protein